MAPLALSADEKQAALDSASSEIKFLLSKEGVSTEAQENLYHVGATTLAKLSAFFVDEADLRTVAKEELGIDPTASLQKRSELAGLIVAYNQAKTRTAEVAKHLGELDARSQTKPLIGTDFLAMRAAYEKIYCKLEDQECPSRIYLERRITELESGDMRAESLRSVLHRDQDGEEQFIPQWDASGSMKLKRSVTEIEDPSNPEELRRRLGIMVNAMVFLSLQHTNRPELKDVKPDLAGQYATYLLGDHVWSFVAKDEAGLTVASPNWPLIIQYEMAIRKRAYREVAERGITFPVALKESWLDPLTKERFFTTPLSISSATGGRKIEVASSTKRQQEENSWGSAKKQKNGGKGGTGKSGGGNFGKGGFGKGGGGSKGGKSGKGLQIPLNCARTTPDGKPICFGYNDKNVRCRNPKCAFAHVCGYCFVKHPIYACDGKKKFGSGDIPAPETQGGK